MIVNKIGKRIEDAVVNQMVSVEWKIVGEVAGVLECGERFQSIYAVVQDNLFLFRMEPGVHLRFSAKE
jgi:hypothetical protein